MYFRLEREEDVLRENSNLKKENKTKAIILRHSINNNHEETDIGFKPGNESFFSFWNNMCTQ